MPVYEGNPERIIGVRHTRTSAGVAGAHGLHACPGRGAPLPGARLMRAHGWCRKPSRSAEARGNPAANPIWRWWWTSSDHCRPADVRRAEEIVVPIAPSTMKPWRPPGRGNDTSCWKAPFYPDWKPTSAWSCPRRLRNPGRLPALQVRPPPRGRGKRRSRKPPLHRPGDGPPRIVRPGGKAGKSA